jgi:hypothetical protein
MIARIWHGYTTKANADVYEKLLQDKIFPGIEKKNMQGYLGPQLLRRELEEETEFITQLWFKDMDSVKAFVGVDYENIYVPDEAREVLLKFDQKAVHCELRYSLNHNFGSR